jgi:HSP20 family molecular chaperone IbpA
LAFRVLVGKGTDGSTQGQVWCALHIHRETTARDFPPINIWLGENSVVVTAELPGVTRDDLTISLQEDVLTLEGKREPNVQEDNVNWQRRERAYGTFSRGADETDP